MKKTTDALLIIPIIFILLVGMYHSLAFIFGFSDTQKEYVKVYITKEAEDCENLGGEMIYSFYPVFKVVEPYEYSWLIDEWKCVRPEKILKSN